MKVVNKCVKFQSKQVYFIWSYINLDMDEILKRGQAVCHMISFAH
jgi:hypothetical protein